MSGFVAGLREAMLRAPRSGTSTKAEPGRRPGWQIVAAKEFADHLVSARFYVLLVILGIAALIPIYFAADRLRSLAEGVSGAPAVFLLLFQVGPEGIDFLRVDVFVSMAAPLLGIAFAFDAVNGERHEGTLPRLLSQPIHRDDVINGKFAAGLAAIALVLAAVLLVISGFGIVRLGIVPSLSEAIRLVSWYALNVLYVAMWLAFGLLLSVVINRAATSALIGFGTWLFVAIPFFGPLLVSLVASVISPVAGDINQQYAAVAGQQFLTRLLPSTLYREATLALLNPAVTTTSSPSTFNEALQYQERLQGIPVDVSQSLLIIWPHIVALLAITAVCFAAAYIKFMRQEVRA